MGQRANLIIVSNDTYDLYYSHWCANTLPKDLFWGPQYAIKFIEMQTKVDVSGWLDDVWAEGGAVLDLDNKKLVFYGGEDILFDIPLRNLFLSLMNKTWYGWKIEWAYEGILDLASYVGYPKEKVLTGRVDDIKDLSLAPPEEKNWVNTVASVKFSDNEMLLFPLCGEIEVYLSFGPEIVNKIDKSYGYTSLSLSEWTEGFPVGGFHIDVTEKRVEFWHANNIPDISKQLVTKWSDWKVREYYCDYESQVRSTRGLLQFHSIDRQRLLTQLRALLLKESSNPLDTLSYIVKQEAGAGRTVEINPYALRYDRYDLPRSVREEILEYAVDSL
ncbi:hypothetical protein [Paenibacillus sp. FSL H7-0331]|uniref:hypothetical protein n=1 Tax=Paenibacillus sp. FSL H7-0331 TaxID=1920421 RepID=UPI00096FF5D7|nr:hypothetical protein [Paenibacillus sp. FSL H7-0331]OMF07401.1 hypothetical protein BK127_29215 [Paenibacillus sp. FSL H7-0331]